MGDARPADKTVDAGARSLDHYRDRLSPRRYALRELLIPIVRWETPHLAAIQAAVRTPALDSYFALTANLGTHTFFMAGLPMIWWCGYTSLGRAMMHQLAAGVFFTGFIKDTVCLPRPLSPPLQRISRSVSAALEYGFPSTHSTNAGSVAVYSLFALSQAGEKLSPSLRLSLQCLATCYAISIVTGRLYCGMHGFFDVVVGLILGAAITFVQWFYGPAYDEWIFNGAVSNIILVTLIIAVLIRIHPEPADNCPCFDDSVAFAGVHIGCDIGHWHFGQTSFASNSPFPSTIPFSFAELGLIKTILRLVLGVIVIFTWRATVKKTLHTILPPLFRVIEKAGLSLPRVFFLKASQYTKVPPLKKDDNVIPPASEIPRFITSLRHPRKRAVSIGPQSQADAYEAIAFRERRRRESISSLDGARSRSPASTMSSPSPPAAASPVLGPADVKAGFVVAQHEHPVEDVDHEKEDREMFLKLQRPRVRYDVEVVTKLIVYAGIAWWAVEGNPILFWYCGLAPKGYR